MVKAGSKRRLQKEATRGRIIEAARRVYMRQGFSASADSIAKAAGVAHGTIFVHFPSREDLRLQILETFAREAGDKLHEISVDGCGIAELLYAHISILEEYEPFYKNLLLDMPSLPRETRMSLASLHSVMSLHFSAVILRGRQAGTVKDIPPHLLFNTWIGLVHYYLRNGDMFAPGKRVLPRRKAELVGAFIALVSK
jgi:AcrR family transcriptional regulator